MEKNCLHVAFTCNENYQQHLAVAIHSLFETNKKFKNINVYVLTSVDQFSHDDYFKNLERKYNRIIRFINCENLNQILDRSNTKIKWYEQHYILFLSMVLKDLDRVIYLDCDVVVNASLYELWNYDLSGKEMGAVIECMGKDVRERLGYNNQATFNAGTVLFDLDNFRKSAIQEQIIDFISTDKERKCFEYYGMQDVLNVIMKDKFIILPKKYNYKESQDKLPVKYLMERFSVYKYYSQEEQTQAKHNPVVVHFCTGKEYHPWTNVYRGRCKALYWKYANMIPWAVEEKYRKNLKIILLQIAVRFHIDSLLLKIKYMQYWK